jgi:hypothetical protein
MYVNVGKPRRGGGPGWITITAAGSMIIRRRAAAVLPPPAAAALVANAFSPENCLH